MTKNDENLSCMIVLYFASTLLQECFVVPPRRVAFWSLSEWGNSLCPLL